MKRMLMIAAMMCCTLPCFSQTPNAEIFGGYSFAHMGSDNMNKGWVGSVTGNFTNWFGIEGDINGQYLNQDELVVSGTSVVSTTAKLNILAYRAGPRFSLRSGDGPATPFVHVLVGGAHTTLSGSANVNGTNYSVSQSADGFASLAGGGIDIGKGPVAVRAQVDYSMLRVDNLFGASGTSNGVRVSGGVVFHLR